MTPIYQSYIWESIDNPLRACTPLKGTILLEICSRQIFSNFSPKTRVLQEPMLRKFTGTPISNLKRPSTARGTIQQKKKIWGNFSRDLSFKNCPGLTSCLWLPDRLHRVVDLTVE